MILDKIRAKYGPMVAREFQQAIERVKGNVDWTEVESMIDEGRVTEALETVVHAAEAEGLAGLDSLYRDLLIAAGTATAGFILERLIRRGEPVPLPPLTLDAPVFSAPLVAPTSLNISFDVTPTEVTQSIRTQQLDRIVDISEQTRDAIRIALTRGIDAGDNPKRIAVEIRQSLGLTDRMEQAILNYQTALENGDLSALRRALRDRRFDSSVENQKLTPEKIERMVQRYRERYLKYRSEMIARTETARAISTGQHLMWSQAIQKGIVREDQILRKWIYTQDGKTRHAHISIPGMNEKEGVGFAEPFQSPLGPIMFPGDPNATAANTINCRCSTFYRLKTDEL